MSRILNACSDCAIVVRELGGTTPPGVEISLGTPCDGPHPVHAAPQATSALLLRDDVVAVVDLWLDRAQLERLERDARPTNDAPDVAHAVDVTNVASALLAALVQRDGVPALDEFHADRAVAVARHLLRKATKSTNEER